MPGCGAGSVDACIVHEGGGAVRLGGGGAGGSVRARHARRRAGGRGETASRRKPAALWDLEEEESAPLEGGKEAWAI